jgi:NTE family protein
MKHIFLIIVTSLILLATQAVAQRPKIGLTLSGGGAKGLAHVGILQALDSAGLKVDYITGTSMGSIVGAMYAIGYSGNQIDSISKLLNWDDLLSGKPKYTDVGIEEKDEFSRYSFEIPFDGTKAKMGTGLIESEEIWLQFSEIFFHVYDQTDFSGFNIPFKCIATDLSNGNAVVLDSGQIVKALRSSMAIPSVLTSVEYNNTQLVDGGIVRNFPVSDVIKMGADYTIGVNLFAGLVNADQLNSALDVMYQITNYRDAEDLKKQKKLCNILIEPPVSDYSAGSFSEAGKILDIGYQMREKYYPVFKRLADSLNKIEKIDYEPYKRLNANKEVIIDSYEFVGLKSLSGETVIKKSGLSLGKAYDADELNQAFRRIYSSLLFQYIYYELVPTEQGHAKMVIKLKEQYPGMLKFTFNFNSFTTPAIIINYTWRNLLFERSRTLAKLAISQDVKLRLEHKQFFGGRLNNAMTINFDYIQQRLPIYNNDVVENLYKTGNLSTGIALHHYAGRHSAFGVGFTYRRTDFSPDIASTFRFNGFNQKLVANLGYEFNSLDRSFLPTKGVSAKINLLSAFARNYSAAYVGTDSLLIDTIFTQKPNTPLFRIDFHLDMFKKVSDRVSILSNIQGGAIIDDNNFYLDNLFVGGSQQVYRDQFMFSGYSEGQLPASSFVSGLLGIQYRIWEQLFVLGKANIGVYNFMSGFGLVDDINDQFISGFSASIAYNLSMLPIELSLNYSPETNRFFTGINIGYVF